MAKRARTSLPMVEELSDMLIGAAEYDNLVLSQTLLRIPMDLQADCLHRALETSIVNDNYWIVERLMCRPEIDPMVPASVVIGYQRDKILREILRHPRINPNELLRMAIKRHCFESVSTILQNAVCDPSFDNDFPIRKLAEHGHLKLVQKLLEYPQVNPAAEKNLALRLAAFHGYWPMVNSLLKHPLVLHETNHGYVLKCAVEYGKVAVVKNLLKEELIDNKEDMHSAYRLALQYNQSAIVNAMKKDYLRVHGEALPEKLAKEKNLALKPLDRLYPPMYNLQPVILERQCPVCFEDFQTVRAVLAGHCGHLICAECHQKVKGCHFCDV